MALAVELLPLFHPVANEARPEPRGPIPALIAGLERSQDDNRRTSKTISPKITRRFWVALLLGHRSPRIFSLVDALPKPRIDSHTALPIHEMPSEQMRRSGRIYRLAAKLVQPLLVRSQPSALSNLGDRKEGAKGE